jgi:hypothetical protein
MEINKEEIDKDIEEVNLMEQGKPHYENEETNNKGFDNTVITVTAVTNKIRQNLPITTRNTILLDTLYRLYEGDGTWTCKNCTDKGNTFNYLS